ncbi:Uu.00g110760.m01.CDS01 [Anthostomella pinea]|uniref:Uu.00g110760.m01.CDS01 n=1 Tax=Anthostomella pinea TaxID=933095 RepID=A0AAI8VEV7_9PEZI|nr:Uu.00g110760.m01.CDS01 [Anthostomella pinea]
MCWVAECIMGCGHKRQPGYGDEYIRGLLPAFFPMEWCEEERRNGHCQRNNKPLKIDPTKVPHGPGRLTRPCGFCEEKGQDIQAVIFHEAQFIDLYLNKPFLGDGWREHYREMKDDLIKSSLDAGVGKALRKRDLDKGMEEFKKLLGEGRPVLCKMIRNKVNEFIQADLVAQGRRGAWEQAQAEMQERLENSTLPWEWYDVPEQEQQAQ